MFINMLVIKAQIKLPSEFLDKGCSVEDFEDAD